VLSSWAGHFTLTVPLSTQVYKWVLANCWGNFLQCWGVASGGQASHPRVGVSRQAPSPRKLDGAKCQGYEPVGFNKKLYIS